MTIVDERIKEWQGLRIHFIHTKKYKTNTFVWKMKAPINDDDVSLRALLPYVLQSNCEKFPTTSSLRSYLDELYGGTLYVDLAKKGEYHIISITMELANEKFLSDAPPLLEKGIQLLRNILLEPKVTNHAFDKETVEKEKRTLKQRIQSVYDDKIKYSNVRLVEEMCKGEPYALHVHGSIDKIDEITPESLYHYYQRTLQEDEIDLYIIGDFDEGKVFSAIQEQFPLPERKYREVGEDKVYENLQVKKVNDVQDVKQGKLNIGYRTNVKYGDEDYFALQVMNGIYGGFAHSKLFLNVREKASLAYYVVSRLESHKGLMMVMSGVDEKNYEKAMAIIEEQMHGMKNGDITEEEMAQTKAVIKNQLLETIDSPRGMVEILYHNVVAKKDISLNDWLEEIEKVTKDEIVKVAQKVHLDTIYFLSGTEVVQ